MENQKFSEKGGYAKFNEFLESTIIKKKDFLWGESFEQDDVKTCLKILIKDNKPEKGKTFDIKINEQFGKKGVILKRIICNVEYLWALGADDISSKRKEKYANRWVKSADDKDNKENKDEAKKLKTGAFIDEGIGNTGMYHKTNKYWEIRFLLRLMWHLMKEHFSNTDDIKTKIVEIVKEVQNKGEKYSESEIFQNDNDMKKGVEMDKPRSCGMYNVLLHLANPAEYEPIVSRGHKEQIVSFFSFLLPDNKTEDIDAKIKEIRKELSKKLGKNEFSFYDQEIAKYWRLGGDEGGDLWDALKYKKAVVLYGAPGTSKTFTANRLAETFILRAYFEKNKKFPNPEDIVKGKIHHLQLHPNYQYEDFVAGVKIVNNTLEAQEGAIFEYCRAAAEEDKEKLPHIVILDEINRVDLPRMLGEVFSAMENRGQELEIPCGNKIFKLKIPENLYFIGTMNEIDFSLERLDFALRRRFLWFPHGYNENTLRDIIEEKTKGNAEKPKEEELDDFCDKATALNKKIAADKNLGQAYQIGHTFFAEIVDIFKMRPSDTKLFYPGQKKGAAYLLWQISLKPLLEAMLGNVPNGQKDESLKKFEEVFLPQKEKKEDTTKTSEAETDK